MLGKVTTVNQSNNTNGIVANDNVPAFALAA